MADEEAITKNATVDTNPENKATQRVNAKGQNKTKHKEGDSFHLKVYSPFKVYFDGEVTSVSAINTTGYFDILAGHHNFLTLLAPCEIIIRGSADDKIKISRGIMHVKADDAVIFLDV